MQVDVSQSRLRLFRGFLTSILFLSLVFLAGASQAQNSEISGWIWLDFDGDGFLTTGEPVIEGAEVRLLDAQDTLLQTKLTAADGSYAFPSLNADIYTVQVMSYSLPPGVVLVRLKLRSLMKSLKNSETRLLSERSMSMKTQTVLRNTV